MKRRFFRFSLSVLALFLAIIVALSIAPTYAQSRLLSTIPPTNTKHAPAGTLEPTPIASAVLITPTPSPTLSTTKVSIPARICSGCLRIRLRATPGTAGDVLSFLDDSVQLTMQGRSDDGMWVQVEIVVAGNTTEDEGAVGWIATDFVRLQGGQKLDESTLNALPVLDVAVAASPTPASNVGIPGWLSHISATSRQIFLKGQQLGNRANVFSRVGDSMTVSAYFLTPFGRGAYELGEYGQLAGTISYFSQTNARTGNSFVNVSLAAGGGWSSHTLLIPGYSAPELCGQDSPLVCEYKQVKPSVALIMIGTNDSGSGTTDLFEGNLREIVQTSMDMGVIPVLSTIPPKPINEDQTARAIAFNQVIRSVAAQYDVPLWDYFSVMDTLPDKGLSSDHLHASVPPGGTSAVITSENLQYGYTIRNLQALQVLDALRQLVLY